MHVKFQVFRGSLTTWTALFAKAAAFASQVGQPRLVGISHSQESLEGIVTVWYWADGAMDSPET